VPALYIRSAYLGDIPLNPTSRVMPANAGIQKWSWIPDQVRNDIASGWETHYYWRSVRSWMPRFGGGDL